jgi:hypothetical protein
MCDECVYRRQPADPSSALLLCSLSNLYGKLKVPNTGWSESFSEVVPRHTIESGYCTLSTTAEKLLYHHLLCTLDYCFLLLMLIIWVVTPCGMNVKKHGPPERRYLPANPHGSRTRKISIDKRNVFEDLIFHACISFVGSRCSSVSIVSDHGLDDWTIEVRSQAEAKGYFL